MALGTAQTVVVCIPGGQGLQGPCPEGSVQSVTQGYVISASEATRFELASEPFDPSAAGAFFAFGFVSTVFLWLVALGAGMVIRTIKGA